MPIDKTMSDAMLGAFRTMAKECLDKDLTGEHMDKMTAALARMEQLADECTDLNQFNAQLMAEDLFNKFSQSYGAVLAEEAQKSYSQNGGYEDAALLKQTLDAYRDAIRRLREGKQHALSIADDPAEMDTLVNEQKQIESIEKVIAIGESGVNYPTFLRLCIETGADKAMEGSIVMREAMEYALGWARATMLSTPELQVHEDTLALLDSMVASSPFGAADPFQFRLGREKIEHRHAPAILRWNTIRRYWERLLSTMDHWIVSYCSFAPSIDPWALAKNPRRAVKRSQDVTPGEFQIRERIFREYFGLDWEDIFTHESFINEVMAHRMGYSQQWVELLRRTHGSCKPFSRPPDDCIRDAEAWYKTHWADPESHKAAERIAAYYDSVFGSGRYVAKYGPIARNTSKATPWSV